MHKRLVIVEFKTGALIRILINFRVIYDVYIKIAFCMDAFEYVYEIFTVTQLQSAVTKSNKKFTEQACDRFYTSNMKYSCMLFHVY